MVMTPTIVTPGGELAARAGELLYANALSDESGKCRKACGEMGRVISKQSEFFHCFF